MSLLSRGGRFLQHSVGKYGICGLPKGKADCSEDREKILGAPKSPLKLAVKRKGNGRPKEDSSPKISESLSKEDLVSLADWLQECSSGRARAKRYLITWLEDPKVFSKVVEELGIRGHGKAIRHALFLIDSLPEEDHSTNQPTPPSEDASNPGTRTKPTANDTLSLQRFMAVLNALKRCHGSGRAVIQVLERWHLAGRQTHFMVYNAALGALRENGDVDSAEQIFVNMREAALRRQETMKSRPPPAGGDSSDPLEGDGKQRKMSRALMFCMELVGEGAVEEVDVGEKWRPHEEGGVARVPAVVLTNAPPADMISYMQMLGGYAEVGLWREAVRLWKQMGEDQVYMFFLIYHKVLVACERAGKWRECAAVLIEMWRAGHDLNDFSWTQVIGALGRAGHGVTALQLISIVRKQNGKAFSVDNFNRILHGLGIGAQWDAVTEVLNMMKKDKREMSAMTWGTLIGCRRKAGDWREALRLYGEMEKAGHDPSSATLNEIMCAMIQGGRHRRALALFQKKRSEGKLGRPDVRLYNTALSACGGEPRLVKDALRLWEDMRLEEQSPDETSYTLYIGILGRGRKIGEAQRIVDNLKRKGLQPSLRMLNALIDAHAEAANFAGAVEAFAEISRGGMSPSLTSFNAVLKACQRCRRGGEAVGIYDGMLKDGHQPDTYTYTSLLAALEASGLAKSSLVAYRRMRAAGMLQPTEQFATFWYSKVIGACASGGENDTAWEVFKEMQKAGVPPDEETFLGLLKTCEASGDWKAAMNLFENLGALLAEQHKAMLRAKAAGSEEEDGLSPEEILPWEVEDEQIERRENCSVQAYNMVIGSFGAAGEVDQAVQMFERMKRDKVCPSLETYAQVVRVLQEAGEWERALQIYEEIPLHSTGVRALVNKTAKASGKL